MNTTASRVEVYGNVGNIVLHQRPTRPGLRWVSALSARWPLRGMRALCMLLRRKVQR